MKPEETEQDIRSKVSRHEANINMLHKGQEDLRLEVKAVEGKVDQGFDRLAGKIDRNQSLARPNVGIQLTAAGLILSAFFYFMRISIMPMKEDIDENSDKHAQYMEKANTMLHALMQSDSAINVELAKEMGRQEVSNKNHSYLINLHGEDIRAINRKLSDHTNEDAKEIGEIQGHIISLQKQLDLLQNEN